MLISHYDETYDGTKGVNYWFICPWWLEKMANAPQMWDTRTEIYNMRKQIILKDWNLGQWRSWRNQQLLPQDSPYTGQSDSLLSAKAVDILLLNAVSQWSKCGLYKVTCFIKQSVDKKALLSSCTPGTAACEETVLQAAFIPAWPVVSPEMSLLLRLADTL